MTPTSPSSRDPGELAPSHNPQNGNGTTKKKKKKKSKRKPPADHIEDPDIVNGTHNLHANSSAVYIMSSGEEAGDVDIEEDDEFFTDADDDDGHNHKSRKDGIWNTNNNEERQRIREFWLQLGEEERRSLVKVEKEAVLKKMKEQQKHSCSCTVCGRKRTAIEEELETLYDAYYEELELYANQQQFGSSNIEYRNDPNAEYDEEDDDEEYEDDEDDEDDYEGSEQGSDSRKELFNFGNSLTVKGGILTVADDLLKNDGKKFLEMMERLAERRMQREEEAAMEQPSRFSYRALKQQKEEERARKEAERLAEEQALRAERERKSEEERKKREEERLRKEAERRAREEERLRREEEKRRKAKEEKEREERRRKEQEAKERKEREERERREREEKAKKEKEEKERRQREERERKEREARERREREARERKEREEQERREREERARRDREERERREREERERKEREEKEMQRITILNPARHAERKRTIPPIGQPPIPTQPQPPPINNPPVVQTKAVTMPNGAINWIPVPPHHPINPAHSVNPHIPPPPNHSNHIPPHPIFNQNGPQPQFGQPTGVINPSGMTNEIVNDVYTNNKKLLPPQTNTIPGMNPASSLFTSGLGPMLHPHPGGPPMPMHPVHHPGMRQQIPPRGFIGAAPHLTGPSTGVPPSVASTNLSLLNDSVIGGTGNMGSTGVNANPPPGTFGGLPLGGPQAFNLGTQVVGQPSATTHIGPNVVQNTPLAPIGHRRMSQHPEDAHVKVVQRPPPIQRPRRGSVSAHGLETRTRSPPPGFGNIVSSSALLNDDQSHQMTNRRQSLAPTETSYFSNSLFSALPGG
ncbi:4857_t:CDS:2 [Acaulospora colombiana]|uniref:4857_t:CDS:1 n=1 Tax=Acaulospora colombiana TaxID=27376 RepID=A0ACA9M446_9GLOM|nr:4857_t:CDS:2 [Acaulospora colombiana]